MKLIPNLAEVDRKAIQQAGIPADVLMENAGRQVSQCVQARARITPTQQGVILCGPGNNGGDGFVCARILKQAGFQNITVIYTGKNYRAESLQHFEQLMLLPIDVINACEQTTQALRRLASADFIIDALFGSGLNRPVEGLEAQLIEVCNQRSHPAEQTPTRAPRAPWVIAVDIPSGIDSATGQALGIAMTADETVTFATAKPGLFLYPGKTCAGTIHVADIGIPKSFIAEDDSDIHLLNLDAARHWLPPRLPDSHKYTYGHVLILAGSHAMPGAAVLCSQAAMNAGAGLVTLAAPASVFTQCPMMPEIMRLSLPDEAYLTSTGAETFWNKLTTGKYSAVLLGPGLGQAPETVEAIVSLLKKLLVADHWPVIVDADGLNALSAAPMALNERFILTPHVGEAVRLLNNPPNAPLNEPMSTKMPSETSSTSSSASESLSHNLLDALQSLQTRYQAQIVLKSATTTIASLPTNPASTPQNGTPEFTAAPETAPSTRNKPEPDSRRWISPFGNASMATAGSGDVLAGIIAALAAQCQAQKRPIEDGAPLGVCLHGLAGDASALTRTPYAMRASDITEHLPHAFKVLLNPSDEGSTMLKTTDFVTP